MPHQMRYSVLTVALACVVLFRITPAVAWPWMEQLHGTMWSFSQVVRLGTIDVPKADQGSREHSASAMALLLFLSGMILGVFSGMLLGLVVLPRWHGSSEHEINHSHAITGTWESEVWETSWVRCESTPQHAPGGSERISAMHCCQYGFTSHRAPVVIPLEASTAIRHTYL